jgi:hypothetical protein
VKTLVKRAVLALAMVASLAFLTPALAYATNPPGPTPIQLYHIELKSYNHSVAMIQKTFVQAIANAKVAKRRGLLAATTPAQKSVVIADYNVAINVATTNRQNALNSLKKPLPPPVGHSPTTTTTQLVP